MAGYFRELASHIYVGSEKAAVELANGVFVQITANGVDKIAAAGDAKFRVEEKTTLWGLPALVLRCTSEGEDEIYVTENEWEVYQDKDYDETLYSVPAGHFVKMRRPEVNDQLIITVDATAYAGINVGDTVSPAAGGSVA